MGASPKTAPNGMDIDTTFRAVARELAHASFAMPGTAYDRKAFSAQSYCAAHAVAQRYGMDTAVFNFDKVVANCASLDTQSKRLFLSDVKSAVYPIVQRVDRSLTAVEHTMVAATRRRLPPFASQTVECLQQSTGLLIANATGSFAVMGADKNVRSEKATEAPAAKPAQVKSAKRQDAR